VPSRIHHPRPRAYQANAYAWCFRDIPETILHAGRDTPNPVRETAVFVVHGMGEQAYLDTAATLRVGFEDVIDKLHVVPEVGKVPPPFTYDGYWANYESLEETFPDEWETFGDRERLLFASLWKRRSFSALRTFSWFVRQLFRLVTDRRIRKQAGWMRWAMYWEVVLLGLTSLCALLLWCPRVLSRVLADVRVYLAPEGDIEAAIVQRIDRRVGERFLLLLGLNWDFRSLSPRRQLQISGRPHMFTRVTWVAHSLGTVISYNVISDLFARCRELRDAVSTSPSVPSPDQQEVLNDIARVEKGLHRFVTLGSPLQKIAFLFPGVLRPWPKSCATEIARPTHRRWWINFFHLWDPVSGRLLDKEHFEVAKNVHSRLRRIPGLAHVSYWRDTAILKYIFTRAYGPEVLPLAPIHFLNNKTVQVWRGMTVLLTFCVLTVALTAGVFYGWRWIPHHVPGIAKILWRWAIPRA
jgi:hypothetical protein